jgi:transposase
MEHFDLFCYSIYQRKEVKQFLFDHPRIHMEYFPVYTPELSPVEYVWNQADRALSNSAPENLAGLEAILQNTVRRLRRSQKLL